MNEYAPKQSEARKNEKKTKRETGNSIDRSRFTDRPTHAEVKWEDVRSHNRRKYVSI